MKFSLSIDTETPRDWNERDVREVMQIHLLNAAKQINAANGRKQAEVIHSAHGAVLGRWELDCERGFMGPDDGERLSTIAKAHLAGQEPAEPYRRPSTASMMVPEPGALLAGVDVVASEHVPAGTAFLMPQRRLGEPLDAFAARCAVVRLQATTENEPKPPCPECKAAAWLPHAETCSLVTRTVHTAKSLADASYTRAGTEHHPEGPIW